MKHVRHSYVIETWGASRFYAKCACGWESRKVWSQDAAEKDASQHITDAPEWVREKCEKHPYDTEDEAKAWLVEAKIRASLHHSHKRRESRVYFCLDCRKWHVTSKPSQPGYRAHEAGEAS